MKRFLFAILICCLPSVSFAANYGGTAFALYSAASGTVKTSSVINVRGFKTKSMQVEGVTITSNPGSLTFKNMSGTVLAQCSQDGTERQSGVADL